MKEEQISKLVKLIQENTPLTQKESCCYLLETEDIIRTNEIYKNNNISFGNEYYLLATARLIDQYRR